MIAERREVTKSFRTTTAIAEALKNIVIDQNEDQMSESDIINTALEEYINTNIKKNNEYSKPWNEYYFNRASQFLEFTNTSKTLKISSPKDVAKYFKGKLPKDKEAAYTLYLDTENNLIKTQLMGVGNAETVHTDYSIVIKTALSLNPCHIVVVHNHPGTGVDPSNADIIDANKFYTACQFSNVAFADAIILDDDYNYFSFDEHKFLKKFEDNFLKIDKLFIQKAVK